MGGGHVPSLEYYSACECSPVIDEGSDIREDCGPQMGNIENSKKVWKECNNIAVQDIVKEHGRKKEVVACEALNKEGGSRIPVHLE